MSTGLIALAALFIAYAVVFWLHMSGTAVLAVIQLSYFSCSLAIVCMSLALLLLVRPRLFETMFGGLDRMYRLHEFLGIASLLLFLLHFATAVGEDGDVDTLAELDTASAVQTQTDFSGEAGEDDE